MIVGNLTISDIRFWIHLGNSKEERSILQPISIDIDLSFLATCKASDTDDINDGVCYEKLVLFIKQTIHDHQFNLIERCAKYLHNQIVEYLDRQNCKDVEAKVVVHKINIPVENIHGSVSFSYSSR
ncbi:MAG: dihydroneopterin aldolase [Rickettsiaceae bacterium]